MENNANKPIIMERVSQPIREPLDQPITALITERENVYKKCFSQSTPSPDEDLQVALETSVFPLTRIVIQSKKYIYLLFIYSHNG